MEYFVQGFNLQATLSAGSAISGSDNPKPHHPITCSGALGFLPDEGLWCEHAKVDADDLRLSYALTQTIAVLLMEQAHRL